MQPITRSHGSRSSKIVHNTRQPTCADLAHSIIRIILMIPVYSTVSFLSYFFYKNSIYFEVLRDCYEAFAIAAFFTLLCHYIAPNLHDQKDYFRQLQPINWFWGVFGLQKCTGGKHRGCLRIPGSGLTWFNVSGKTWRVEEMRTSFTEESTDKLPIGHLDWHLPVLLHSRLIHYCERRYSSDWTVLRIIFESCFCQNLG